MRRLLYIMSLTLLSAFSALCRVMFVKADKTQRGKIGEGTPSQKKLANLIVHTSRSMKKNSDERSTVE